jgi:hypothetical protein
VESVFTDVGRIRRVPVTRLAQSAVSLAAIGISGSLGRKGDTLVAQPDDGSAWLCLVNAVPRAHSLLAQVMAAADHGGVVVLDRAHRRGRERIAGAAMEGWTFVDRERGPGEG